ncbi:MAG: hypothetical protein CMP10_02860 [Zetaproteobacteria bacterium]|nr:hypothetical protein [Pseudobdellovibrionaceae bacterium]
MYQRYKYYFLTCMLLMLGFVAEIAIAESNQSSVAVVLGRKAQSVTGGSAGNLPERIYNKLAKAQKYLAADKYDDALRILKKLEKSQQRRPAALAQVLQTQGYVYAQMENFKDADTALDQAIKLNKLPMQPTLRTMYTRAQVLVAAGRYQDAVPIVQDVIFSSPTPKPEHYFFLAQVLAQLKEEKTAIIMAETALELAESPKENWLQLLVALYYESKLFEKSAVALEKLVTLRPNKIKYWRQLSGVYINLDQSDKALSSLEVAYKQGVLKEERELLQLARLSMFRKVPYKAGNYLNKAFKEGLIKKTQKNYELEANAWIQAQELKRAQEALALAAPLSKNGEVFMRQGQLYLAQDKWSLGEIAIDKALKKGGIKKPGLAWLTLGIAKYQSKKFKGAANAFQKAVAYEAYKKQAIDWLNHLKDPAHRI